MSEQPSVVRLVAGILFATFTICAASNVSNSAAYVRLKAAAAGYGVLAQINNIPFVIDNTTTNTMCGWTAMQAARYTKPVSINYENETIDGGVFIVSMYVGGHSFNCSAVSGMCWQLAVNGNKSSVGVDRVWLQPGDELDWTYEKY